MKGSADFSCSLCRLRLKFVQTTRVVCTDFAEVLTLGNAQYIFLVHLYRNFEGKRILKNNLYRVLIELPRCGAFVYSVLFSIFVLNLP